MKKLLLIVLMSLSFIPTIYTKSTHNQSRGHCNSKKCVEPKGCVFLGYGLNLATDGNTFLKGAMFDTNGCKIGEVTASATTEEGPVINTFSLHNGSTLKVVLAQQASLESLFPVDENTVACFPELAPYLNNPDAALLTTSCNHRAEGDPSVLEWKGTGSFKKANVLQVRCAFLLLKDVIAEQVGCQWFIATQK